jgi:ArsR family transcriptional regulator
MAASIYFLDYGNILLDKVSLFDYHRTMMNNNMIKIFKALSSEQRLNIFKMLYEWQQSSASGTSDYADLNDVMERCFTKVCCCTNLSRSTISHHFKELENAGLITCTRNGQSFICKINMEAVEVVRDFLK